MFSQIQIIGNLGKDPEMNYTPTGMAVTKFSLAVNKKKGGKDVTTWYNIAAFNKTAETLNTHCQKGMQLFIQGELDVRPYTTKEGKQNVSLDVVVDKFSFVGGSKREGGSHQGEDVDPLGDLEDHPF